LLSLKRKALLAGLLGNAIEWYDFALYGHFSMIIGQTFFPKEKPELAMLSAFALFSVSFFMRPLGALVFSYIGDRYGRKRALYWSMLGMALPTACIGFLPGYHQIGVVSTLGLILIRLLQGLALGGEMGGAITYVMENSPPGRTGLCSSLIQASTCFGTLMGSLISSLLAMMMTEANFENWGWRLPFVLGLVAAWIGNYIRRQMPESVLYEQARDSKLLAKNPISDLLSFHRKPLLIGTAILIPMTSSFFMAFVYFNSFMTKEMNFSLGQALLVTSTGLVLAILTTLLGGVIADRWGAKPLLSASLWLLLVGIFPILVVLTGKPGWISLMSVYLCLCGLVGLYTSAAFGLLSNLFPTAVRYSGVSFAINIASPIFGSTVPLLATWLIQKNGLTSGLQVLAMYLFFCFGLGLLAVRHLPTFDVVVRSRH
jgi:MHS family proline/betaine transporter-like MFS transporter